LIFALITLRFRLLFLHADYFTDIIFIFFHLIFHFIFYLLHYLSRHFRHFTPMMLIVAIITIFHFRYCHASSSLSDYHFRLSFCWLMPLLIIFFHAFIVSPIFFHYFTLV